MFDIKTKLPEGASASQHLLNMAEDLECAEGVTMWRDTDDRAPRDEANWVSWHKSMVAEALRFSAQHTK